MKNIKEVSKMIFSNVMRKVFESSIQAATWTFVSKKFGKYLENMEKKSENPEKSEQTEQIRIDT